MKKHAMENGYELVRIFDRLIDPTTHKDLVKVSICELVEYLESAAINKLMIYDWTSLTTNINDFVKTVYLLNHLNISLHIFKPNLETFNERGWINRRVMKTIEALESFDYESKILSKSKMVKGYKRYIKGGGCVGRKVGYRKSRHSYFMEYAKQIEMLKKHIPLKQIRTITGTSINTLRKLRDMRL